MTWKHFLQKSLKKTAKALIYVYQATLAGLLGGSCRYEPTCSRYALDAFDSFPPHQAFWLSLKRIGRCHPFKDGGYDPLPSNRSEWHKGKFSESEPFFSSDGRKFFRSDRTRSI